MEEVWKDIPKARGKYQISNKGRVRSLFDRHQNKRSSPIIMKKNVINNYNHVGIHIKTRKCKQIKVGRTVAKAFIPNRENKPCVNHKDGNKINDCVDNLEWCTHKENMIHAVENGLLTHDHTTGENNYNAKLTENDVLDIRNAYKLGCFTQQEIADAYDMPAPAISRIINKKRWSHI